jgi:hypothetical protein
LNKTHQAGECFGEYMVLQDAARTMHSELPPEPCIVICRVVGQLQSVLMHCDAATAAVAALLAAAAAAAAAAGGGELQYTTLYTPKSGMCIMVFCDNPHVHTSVGSCPAVLAMDHQHQQALRLLASS